MAKTYKPGSSLLADPAEQVVTVVTARPIQPVYFQPSFNNGDDTNIQTSVTNQDSYNATSSRVQSTSDSGNATLTIGAATGAANEYGPLLFGIFGLLGGLYLLTR